MNRPLSQQTNKPTKRWPANQRTDKKIN